MSDDQGCAFAAWDLAICSMPTKEINEIHEDGTSLLFCMLTFLMEMSIQECEDPLMEHLILKFMQRRDLSLAVLKSISTLQGIEVSEFYEYYQTAPVMWLCMRAKRKLRNRGSAGWRMDYILERVPDATLEFCFVECRWIVPGNGDNILQYILEPASSQLAYDKSISEAHLCQVVAQRLSQADHIHRNFNGICALSYAEQFVHNTIGMQSVHCGAWVRVRNIITENMLNACHVSSE